MDDIEILTLGGSKEQGAKEGYRPIFGYKTGYHDLPYVNDLIGLADALAHGKYIVYTSDHFIFARGLSLAVDIASEQFDQFLIVGRHWGLDIKSKIDYSLDNWEYILTMMVALSGKLGSRAAKDYFIYPKSLRIQLPPFLVGREWWDTWWLWRARMMGIPTIDATDLILGIHQEHGFPSQDGTKHGLTADPAGQHNERIFWETAEGYDGRDLMGSIDHTPYVIKYDDTQSDWILINRVSGDSL